MALRSGQNYVYCLIHIETSMQYTFKFKKNISNHSNYDLNAKHYKPNPQTYVWFTKINQSFQK